MGQRLPKDCTGIAAEQSPFQDGYIPPGVRHQSVSYIDGVYKICTLAN